MKSDSGANTGFRWLLTWILVLLVLANIAVWTAWPFKDELVALGILPPPPIERVDLDPRPLPPIVERADPSADAPRPFESHATGEPESEETEPAVPTPEEAPAAPPPEVARQPPLDGQPSSPEMLDCVVVGPIGSREALGALARRLRSTGSLVDSMEEADSAPPEYVVYIEPAPSRDAALAVLQQLEAQSIRDAAVIFSGSNENAVAVGVFRSRSRADARRDQITALGYAVNVRERDGAVHRLRVQEVSAEALGDLAYEPCGESEAG